MGVHGTVANEALHTHHEGEAQINAAFGKATRKVVVVADHTKLGVHAFAKILDTSQVHTLITDSEADTMRVKTPKEAKLGWV